MPPSDHPQTPPNGCLPRHAIPCHAHLTVPTCIPVRLVLICRVRKQSIDLVKMQGIKPDLEALEWLRLSDRSASPLFKAGGRLIIYRY